MVCYHERVVTAGASGERDERRENRRDATAHLPAPTRLFAVIILRRYRPALPANRKVLCCLPGINTEERALNGSTILRYNERVGFAGLTKLSKMLLHTFYRVALTKPMVWLNFVTTR